MNLFSAHPLVTVETLVTILAFVHLAQTGVIAIFWRIYHRYPGTGLWAIANLLIATGFLIWLTSFNDLKYASHPLGNTINAVGMAVLMVGTLRFTGRTGGTRRGLTIVGIAALLQAFFTVGLPSPPARALSSSVVCGTLALTCLWMLIRTSVALPGFGRWITSAVLGCYVAGLLARIVLVSGQFGSPAGFPHGGAQVLMLLLWPVAGILWSVGFEVLLLERMTADLKATSAALKRQSDFNQATLENLTAGVIVFDRDGTPTFTNPAALELCGVLSSDSCLYGRDPQVYELDGRTPIARENLPMARAVRGEPVRDAEFVIRRTDGSMYRLLASGGPLNGGGLLTLTDVTQLRRTEEALQRTEMRFRAAFNGAAVGMALLGPDGRFLQVNPALCRTLGYSEQELRARTLQKLSHAHEVRDEQPRWDDLWAGRLASYQSERRCRPKDGQPLWTLFNISGVDVTDGRPAYAVCQIQDITPRKRAEEALRANKVLLNDILDNMPAAVSLKDRQGRYVRVNRAFAEQVGRTIEEVQGRTDRDLFPAHVAAGFEEFDREVWHNGEVREQTQQAPGPNGQLTVITRKIPLHDSAGETYGICGVMTNITERMQAESALRESEGRYRRIVETANEGIWTLDAEGRTSYVNHRMAELLGYTPEQMAGRPAEEFLDGDVHGAHPMLYDRMRSPSGTRQEVQFRRRDGQTVHALLATTPIDGPDGSPQGILGMVTDITTRVEAERAARETQSRLEQVADNIVGGMVFQALQRPDSDPAVAWVSSGVESLIGVTQTDAMTDVAKLTRRIHPEDVAEMWDRYRTAGAVLQPFEMIVRVLGPDDEYRWLNVRCTPRRIDETIVWDGVAVDVTAQERALRGLAEREAMLRQLGDNLPNGAIFRCVEQPGAELVFTYLSAGFNRVTGLSADDVLELGYPIDHQIIEEDRRRFDETLQAALRAGTAFDAEVRIRHVEGPIRWIHFRLAPHQSQDSVRYWDGILVDITAAKTTEQSLRVSEELYRSVMESQTDLLARLRPDGTFTFVNDVFCRMFGKTREELLESDWRFIPHPDDLEKVQNEIVHLRADNPVVTITNRIVDAQGKVRWMEFVNRGFFDAHGALIEFQSAARDISERKQAEEVMQHAKEMAEAANRAKSEFLANMSHEVRTPVAAVLGYADILLDRGLSRQEIDQSVQAIRQNGTHLLGVLDDILDLAKIEARKMQLERLPYSPWRLVQEVVSSLQVRADERRVQLVARPLSDLPRQLLLDPTRVRQVLMNLVSNAVKFSGPGKPVEVRVSATPAVGDRPAAWLLEVEDQGIGMQPEQLEQIFQPFQQADNGHSRKFGGTGLGLSITKRLVHMMGGKIGVRSEFQRGSCFTVCLPMTPTGDRFEWSAAAELMPLPEQEPAAQERSRANPQFGGRVLLAEDNEDNRRVLLYFLSRLGIQAEVAVNGKIALDKARTAAYDVILMDMQMPEMDGYSATQELRRVGYLGPIVALTAHSLSDDRDKCLNAGCTDYLTKPVNVNKLGDALSRYLPTVG